MGDVEKHCPDSLWHLAQPLLPEHPKRHQGGGRNRIDDRIALSAILYVLDSGCAWAELSASFPISYQSAHRRFAEWVEQDVMAALHQAMLDADEGGHRMIIDGLWRQPKIVQWPLATA